MFATHASSSDPTIRYYGLKNYGATCYLNSVLQVLFMTEDFREAVNSPANIKFIDHHLKNLFDHLVNENSDALDLIKALDIDAVDKEQDAAEYCQKILKLTSPEAAKIFHGELTNRCICSSCGTETDTDEPFWILPLSLVYSRCELYSVKDGISEFFKTSSFSGENQMYCEHCDTKVDARTNYVVKHHPEVLILMLKRFDFSYKYMRYIKINDAVDVPTFLEIPENQTYELYAVVDHFGDLRGGHYCSRIRSQDDSRWYEFNDTWVTPIDYNIDSDIKRCETAFLLFYRRKDIKLYQATSSHKDDNHVSLASSTSTTATAAALRPALPEPDQDALLPGAAVSALVSVASAVPATRGKRRHLKRKTEAKVSGKLSRGSHATLSSSPASGDPIPKPDIHVGLLPAIKHPFVAPSYPHEPAGVEAAAARHLAAVKGRPAGRPVLIVGDSNVQHVRVARCCTLSLSEAVVNDINKSAHQLTIKNPFAKTFIIHAGFNILKQQQSEILKIDFSNLIHNIQLLNINCILSGPLLAPRYGDLMFSRVRQLHIWLKTYCHSMSIPYIDNFTTFYQRPHHFKADGLHLNKQGSRLLSMNIDLTLCSLKAISN